MCLYICLVSFYKPYVRTNKSLSLAYCKWREIQVFWFNSLEKELGDFCLSFYRTSRRKEDYVLCVKTLREENIPTFLVFFTRNWELFKYSHKKSPAGIVNPCGKNWIIYKQALCKNIYKSAKPHLQTCCHDNNLFSSFYLHSLFPIIKVTRICFPSCLFLLLIISSRIINFSSLFQ